MKKLVYETPEVEVTDMTTETCILDASTGGLQDYNPGEWNW